MASLHLGPAVPQDLSLIEKVRHRSDGYGTWDLLSDLSLTRSFATRPRPAPSPVCCWSDRVGRPRRLAPAAVGAPHHVPPGCPARGERPAARPEPKTSGRVSEVMGSRS